MIVRLWTTGIISSKAAEYDGFASSRSLAMFKTLDGCLGVIFIRSDTKGYALSFWDNAASVEALADSELYQNTVSEIVAAGFLKEPQTSELVDVTGGFLLGDVPSVFTRLAI
jgi:hypothetical protein